MTRRALTWVAMLGSAAMLLTAFAFQYFGGLVPCVLCIYQRWPHGVAVLAGILALTLGGRGWLWLGALAAAATAAVGVYHAGVELTWWEGLATCTVDTLQGLSVSDLLNTDVTVGAPVRCDAVPWAMFGISMAGWNAIVSAGLCLIWLAAARSRHEG
ncbi:MAG: disulfide bond formation protein B [Cypionkella sp.]